MKTIIAGSRDITDYSLVCRAISESKFNITEVISGTARGVDTLGEKWVADNKIPVKKFFPNWSIGKQAGFLRNLLMEVKALNIPLTKPRKKVLKFLF